MTDDDATWAAFIGAGMIVLLARSVMEAGFAWLLAGLRPRSVGWWMVGAARRLIAAVTPH